MNIENLSKATIETLPQRESMVKQATPPKPLKSLEFQVPYLQSEKPMVTRNAWKQSNKTSMTLNEKRDVQLTKNIKTSCLEKTKMPHCYSNYPLKPTPTTSPNKPIICRTKGGSTQEGQNPE